MLREEWKVDCIPNVAIVESNVKCCANDESNEAVGESDERQVERRCADILPIKTQGQ